MKTRFLVSSLAVAALLFTIVAVWGANRHALGESQPGDQTPGPPAITNTSTATPTTSEPTQLPTVVPTVAPAATKSPDLFAAPGLGCAACKVKATEQIPIGRQDIQVDAAGKYFVADRGDGCKYSEEWRMVDPRTGLDELLLYTPDCEMTWLYVPSTGELSSFIP